MCSRILNTSSDIQYRHDICVRTDGLRKDVHDEGHGQAKPGPDPPRRAGRLPVHTGGASVLLGVLLVDGAEY